MYYDLQVALAEETERRDTEPETSMRIKNVDTKGEELLDIP